MLTENIKAEMETPGGHLKTEDSENKIFESGDTFLNKSDIKDSGQENDQNDFFHSSQFDYNMEGESLW